jgi:predicted GNAT family acetyltransferase
MATPVVQRNDESRQYEARIDGELAGFAQFQLVDSLIVFPHTEVDPRFEGLGVGSALAQYAPRRCPTRGHPPGCAAVPIHQGLDRSAP